MQTIFIRLFKVQLLYEDLLR